LWIPFLTSHVLYALRDYTETVTTAIAAVPVKALSPTSFAVSFVQPPKAFFPIALFLQRKPCPEIRFQEPTLQERL